MMLNCLRSFCRQTCVRKIFQHATQKTKLSYVSLSCSHTFAKNLTPVNNMLMEIGLSDQECTEILKSCPELSVRNTHRLEEVINVLMKCQFGQKPLTDLILKHPYILCVEPSVLEGLYKNLSTVFIKASVYKVFLNSPNMCNGSWSDLKEKLEYLKESMGIGDSEIVNSSALGYPLKHIKVRHSFLVKTGVFKKASHKMKEKNVPCKNPKLDKILSSSDEYFSTKVAGVTLPEFEVYAQLFEEDDSD